MLVVDKFICVLVILVSQDNPEKMSSHSTSHVLSCGFCCTHSATQVRLGIPSRPCRRKHVQLQLVEQHLGVR
jgi:hypothetical protein